MKDILKNFSSVSFVLVIAWSSVLSLEAQSFATDRLPAFSTYFVNSRLGPVQSRESEHFRVEWVHPRDGIFIDALLQHMEAAHASLEPVFAPAMNFSDKVPIEIYPNLNDFSEVSGLSLSRFRATGTIALMLNQRLMLLSPRNLVSGYSWAETAVHEYIHFLINRLAPRNIPIWLHEGTAQMFQEFPYRTTAELQPSQWGLFQRRRESGKLHNLRILQEPFPMRETPEDAELAYVQALLFSKWLHDQCGIVDLISNAHTAGSLEVSLEVCTKKSYRQLDAQFIPEIMGQIQVPEGSDVAFFARHFSDGDPIDIEGQAADRRSRNFASLAQQLFTQGRYRASTIEMEKALKESAIEPPSWRRQLAISFDRQNKAQEARRVLEQLVRDYPRDAGAWYLLGREEVKAGNSAGAWQRFLRAFHFNPFLDGLETQMLELQQRKPELQSQFLLQSL